MRAFGTALILWMAATGALAQWTVMDVAGTPYDVEFTDAGVAAVATSTALHFVQPTGSVSFSRASPVPLVSGYTDFDGCACDTDVNGQVTCCSAKQITPATGADNVFRVRHSQSGRRYISFNDGTVEQSFAYSPGPFADDYEVWNPCGAITTAIDGLTTGSAEWGVMALGSPGCGFWVFYDGVPANALGYGDHGLSIKELVLYEALGGGVTALLGHSAGASSVTFLDDGASVGPYTPVNGIPPANVTGITFARGTGDEYGDGFGMAIVGGGEDRIYSPIPDPEKPAATWVERPVLVLGSIGPVSRITCDGAKACAAIASAAADNVLLYRNTAAPTVTVAPVSIDETVLQTTLQAVPVDADGDPVFVRWFPDAGTGLTLTPLDAAGTTVEVTRPAGTAVCGSGLDLQIDVTASDGLEGHLGTAQAILHVNHTVPPGVPGVSGPDRVAAGSGAVTLTASQGGGQCPLSGFTWNVSTAVPGGVLTPSGATTTAAFTPPPNLCASEATLEVQVTASDGTLSSAPATYTLVVEGWGPPNAAFPANATATQPAGATVLYAADGGHPCDGTGGLPDSQVEWTLISSDVPGATLMSGSSPVTGPVSATQIGLFAPDCSNGTVVLGATQMTEGSAAPPATLTVEVETALLPVQNAAVDLSATYDAGSFQVQGEVDSDLNCEASRGLTAEVGVWQGGAPLGGTTVIPVPGSYTLPVQVGCGGAALEVVAEVIDADGGRSPQVREPFVAPALAAAVGSIDGGELRVACGEGGRGEVSTRFEAGQCPLSSVQWTQLSGPPLEAPSQSGTSVQLQTASTGLDGLIGETVTLQVEANAGGGNMASATHSLVIVPAAPFITLTQQAAEPIAEQGGILRMSATAQNDSACAISEVTLEQRLHGARYLPGSARLNGEPVEAVADGDLLSVPGVAFAANGSHRLTYSVRPPLLGDFNPRGQAFVKGYAVSEAASLGVPGGGCACGASPGGALALGALLLIRLRSRRRGR